MTPDATIIPQLRAASNTAEDDFRYTDCRYYAIAGMSGLYRRVPRKSQTARPSYDNAIVAEFNGAFIELVRDGFLDQFFDPDELEYTYTISEDEMAGV